MEAWEREIEAACNVDNIRRFREDRIVEKEMPKWERIMESAVGGGGSLGIRSIMSESELDSEFVKAGAG